MSINLIKLDATSSTNDYLKQLCQVVDLPDFTVVTSKYQTHGRGQHHAHWSSEEGKNLLCSVLIKHSPFKGLNIFLFNMMVSLSVYQTLKAFDIPGLKIKWPNDILSEGKKISGILIENSIKSAKEIRSVVGVGINVNQVDFTSISSEVTSMRRISEKEYEVDAVMQVLLDKLKDNFKIYCENKGDISLDYHNLLFRKDEISLFSTNNAEVFEGKITHVDEDGRLVVAISNFGEKAFGVKEISFFEKY